MEIIFHAHHAEISPLNERRAEEGIRKLERRLGRATAATLRFENDGPARRVEITLEASRGRRFVAEATGRYFGPALAEALNRLNHQVRRVKRKPKARGVARA